MRKIILCYDVCPKWEADPTLFQFSAKVVDAGPTLKHCLLSPLTHTNSSANIGLMLVHRLWRRPSTEPIQAELLVIAREYWLDIGPVLSGVWFDPSKHETMSQCCLRRWHDIKPTLAQLLVLGGMDSSWNQWNDHRKSHEHRLLIIWRMPLLLNHQYIIIVIIRDCYAAKCWHFKPGN